MEDEVTENRKVLFTDIGFLIHIFKHFRDVEIIRVMMRVKNDTSTLTQYQFFKNDEIFFVRTAS